MIKKMLKRIFASHFLRSSSIFFIGAIVGSIFNYLFAMSMGRMMGPTNYGVLVALFSWMALITIPTGVVATVAIRFTAAFKTRNEIGKIQSLFYLLSKNIFYIALAVAVILAAAAGPINKFLNIPSRLPTILLGVAIIFMFLIAVTRGILQGLQKFTQLSLNISIDPFIKLLLGLTLVYFGLNVNGALLALIVAVAAAYYLSFVALKNMSFNFRREQAQIDTAAIKSYFKDVFWAFLILTLFVNIDIILVKHFLSAEQAGYYGALSTMGKIVMFISLPITGVMFPMVTGLYEKGEKHWRLLFGSLGLIMILGLAVIAFYFAFPQFAVKALFGSQYLSVARFLPLFGLAILLYSLSYAFVNYFLSIKKRLFLWPLTLIALLEPVLIWLYHDSFLTIIKILISVFGLTLAALVMLYILSKKPQLSQLLSKS